MHHEPTPPRRPYRCLSQALLDNETFVIAQKLLREQMKPGALDLPMVRALLTVWQRCPREERYAVCRLFARECHDALAEERPSTRWIPLAMCLIKFRHAERLPLNAYMPLADVREAMYLPLPPDDPNHDHSRDPWD